MDRSILLIEDDAATRHLLAGNLRHVGYTVCCAQDLVEANTRTGETRPNLVLLDCMATGGHTLAYIHQLRCDSRTAGVAIIVIGLDQQDTVAALESGADDCIRNSLSANEMHARIRAVLRRRAPQQCGELHAGKTRPGFHADPSVGGGFACKTSLTGFTAGVMHRPVSAPDICVTVGRIRPPLARSTDG